MKFLRQLRSLFLRKKLEAEMAAEMRHHLAEQTRRNVEAGMNAEDARYAAQRQFGNVGVIQERVREGRGWLWLEQFWQDIRFTARGLARAPSFTAVASLTLALGIGVNTALFSVVYGVLLEPYPYARPGEIWAAEIVNLKTGRPWGLRLADHEEIAKLPAVRSAMATRFLSARLTVGINPEIIESPQVTGTAFEFLGVEPMIGRGLSPADFDANGEPALVTVLSFRLWQRLFDGDPGALGRTLIINDQPHAIVGVMPPRFNWYTNSGLWLPLPTTDITRGVRPIVRLHPGISPKVANEQLFTLLQEMAKRTPGPYPKDGFSAQFANYLDRSVASGEMRTSLHLLLYAVGFLLLIACTNVANLQLARAAARSREIAVRLAIGAGRGRVIRQLLTESVVLALAGGMLGVLFAFGLTRVIVVLMPRHFVPSEALVTINGWVLLFSLLVSVGAGVLFGLAPALQCTRPTLAEALKDGGHGAAADAAGNRLRNGLVVAEVALSIVLIVGAFLSIRGFVELQRVDRGFRFERLLMVRVPLFNAQQYPTIERRNGFAREYLRRLRGLPGVASATLGNLPGNEAGSGATIPGRSKIPDGITLNYVDADYLPTLGIVLRAGRNFTADDVAHNKRVALVTESAAKLWPNGQSPLGRTIAVDSLVGGGIGDLPLPDAVKEVTVVGVIADVRTRDKRQPPAPGVLVPYSLRGSLNRSFLVRAHGDPAGLVNAVRKELRAIDPEQPMQQPALVEEVFDQQQMSPRFNLILFAALAAVGLGLAAAGIYSVQAYAVTQRTREIGVRMALGASQEAVVGMVLRGGGKLLLMGIVLGAGASVALAVVMKSQIFNVPLLDPFAIAAAVAAMAAVALLACWLPARRAAGIDPMVALRTE